MTKTTISPLRQRMIEDMTVRGFTPGTQRGYLAAVATFTGFFGHPPDQADAEDLRRYQLHMRSSGASATTMNAAVSALRFFFAVTLGRGDAGVGMTTVRTPQRLAVILSPEEVARLLDHAPYPACRNHLVTADVRQPLTTTDIEFRCDLLFSLYESRFSFYVSIHTSPGMPGVILIVFAPINRRYL